MYVRDAGLSELVPVYSPLTSLDHPGDKMCFATRLNYKTSAQNGNNEAVYIVQCRYDTVNFLHDICNVHDVIMA